MNRQYRLLVVDTEERVLRAINSIFRNDFEIHIAHSASKALNILYRYPIDVVLSDSKIRLISGGDFLGKVKNEHPLVRRLLMTVSMDPGLIAADIKSGKIFGYISKPWNIDKFRSLVHKAANTSPLLLSNTDTDDDLANKDALPDPETSSSVQVQNSKTQIKPKPTAIVVVDDNQRVRDHMVNIAQRFSLKVHFVKTYAQAARIIAMIPEVGVVAFGISDQRQKTLKAIELLQRQRDDLSMIALADTSDIKVAVDITNKGKVFRYLHRLANIESFQRTVLFAIRHHRMQKQSIAQTQQRQHSSGQADASLKKSPQAAPAVAVEPQRQDLAKHNDTAMSQTEFSLLPGSKQRRRDHSDKSQDENRSFMLVGEDPKTHNYARVICRNLGMGFYSVNSFSQAVKAIAAHSDIGVMVMDLSENPHQASKALASLHEQNSVITVVAMVNHSHLQTAVELVDRGELFRYLQKPVNSLEFQRAIKAATKHSHMLKGMNYLGKQRDLEKQGKASLADEQAKAGVANIVRLKEFFRQTA
ncbi:MAG: response regulator [Pseudomonadota bacterium]